MSIREELANLCHEQWAGWMKYLFRNCEEEFSNPYNKRSETTGQMVIPAWAVIRWTRQMRCLFNNLPEHEKESDRKEADKFIEILNRELQQERQAKQELLEALDEIIKYTGNFIIDYEKYRQLIEKHKEK